MVTFVAGCLQKRYRGIYSADSGVLQFSYTIAVDDMS
jgi:hypothetical protein